MQDITSLTSVPKSIRALAMMLALSAGSTLGVASAMADDENKDATKVDRMDRIEGDFDQNINEHGQAGERGQYGRAGSSFTISNSWSQNGKSYNVTNKNGEVSVKVDGQQLDAKQWREKDGKIEILDEKGEVEASIESPSMNNGGLRMQFGGNGGRGGGGWGQRPQNGDVNRLLRELRNAQRGAEGGADVAAPRPPVMLGINMSVVEDGVRVDRVIEDLPADKAGVREGDVITKVGGKAITDTTDLLRVMRDQKAGDKLDMVVLRDGKERTLTADLVAYAPELLEQDDELALPAVPGVPEVPVVPAFPEMRMLDNLFGGNNEAAREHLSKLADELTLRAKEMAEMRGDFEQARNTAKKALEEAAERVEAVRKELAESQHGGNVWVAPGLGNGQMFVLPEGNNRARVERRWNRDVERAVDENGLKELREEMRKMREELKEMREKSEQDRRNKP